MFVNTAGLVGIGTTSPAAQLNVVAEPTANGAPQESLRVSSKVNYSFAPAVRSESVTITGSSIRASTESATSSSTSDLSLNPEGTTSVKVLDVTDTASVKVLEIRGADLAEKFPTNDPGQPGMVMEIDPDQQGQLRVCRTAYSTLAAGVVSGANNLAAGAILGNLPGSEKAPPIALTGRVWTLCDASKAPIVAGDLLTTADVPGHAMKAADRDRSHGAIIGKAMTSLCEGEGLVLVLVSLQ
jgi:hypothetical protein